MAVYHGCLSWLSIIGMEFVVVNGLNPSSNRDVLALCKRHDPYLLPAAGIYPLDAACNFITSAPAATSGTEERAVDGGSGAAEGTVNWTHDFPPPQRFDVDAEVEYIEQLAARCVYHGQAFLSTHLFIYLSIYRPIYVSIHPFIHLCIHLFIHLSIRSSMSPSIYPSVYLPACRPCLLCLFKYCFPEGYMKGFPQTSTLLAELRFFYVACLPSLRVI